jgi:hypothetical protein
MLLALIGLASLAGYLNGGTSQAAIEDAVNADWRGTESFSLTNAVQTVCSADFLDRPGAKVPGRFFM